MKKILNTLNSAIIIPAVPLLISAIIKWLYFGYFRIVFLDGAALSFTFFMYHLLCLIGANRMKDGETGRNLVGLYMFCLVI